MSVFKKALEYLTGKQKEKELQEQLKKKEQELAQVNEQLVETELDLNLAKIALEPLKNCKNKVIYNVNSKSVTIIDCNNDNFSGYVEADVIDKLKTATTEEIIALLTPSKEKEPENTVEQEESEIVKPFLGIFEGVDDFEVVGDNLYFKGIKSVAIPSLIAARFVELIEKHRDYVDEQIQTGYLEEDGTYQSLKMFTYWLLLNPIESARKDTLEFVRKNQIPITSNGMLVTFRKVVSKGKSNKELIKFISESYFKVKKNKKSPKNYEVFDDNPLVCVSGNKRHDYNNHVGNLYELYHNLSQFEENIFTDNHTKSKTIRIGEVYKEDEDKVDLDNNKNCSSGLHSGSLSFGSFNAFGDTGVICLVNPMKIRSVPVSDCNKMRSSELFPVAIVDFDDYRKFVETQEIAELSEVYYNESIEFLQEALKNKQFDKLTCQDNLFEMNPREILNVTKILKNRIVTF